MLRVISVKKSLVGKKKVFCVMAGMSPIGKDGISEYCELFILIFTYAFSFQVRLPFSGTVI